jgi:hypothetical protein
MADVTRTRTDAENDWASSFCGLNLRNDESSARPSASPASGADQINRPSQAGTGQGRNSDTRPKGPDPAVVAKIQKSCAVWNATLAKMNGDIDKLTKAVAAASAGHDLGESFEKEFQSVVRPLMTTVDSSLSEMLMRAAQARDAAEHERLLNVARGTLGRITSFVQSNPVIGHLDENPFVPLAVAKTLNTTLSAISNIIR